MSWAEKKISLPSFLGSRNQEDGSRVAAQEEPELIKCGLLKKLKGGNQYKKKYFVLLGSTSSQPAKLLYYDSERKFNSKNPPKREIILEKCFNINRKQDSQDKGGKKVLALSLFTTDDCVQIGFDDREDELNEWLELMLYLQQGRGGNFYGKKPKPMFEYMWQVNVKTFKPDDVTNTLSHITTGPHRLCVTNTSALLYPLGEDRYVELSHPCIRNVRYNDKMKILGLELGRTSPLGSGLLSLDCEEKEVISQLHEVLRRAMSSANCKELIAGSNRSNRFRSSSFSQDRGSKPKGIPHLNVAKPHHRERDRQENLSRIRTISEPVEGGKGGHVTPEPGTGPRRPVSRYSPGILSPTSPVGSVSAGLSDDGTGSSNSINDPYCTSTSILDQLEAAAHNSYSGAPEAIPEESSGEVSIEFKREAPAAAAAPADSSAKFHDGHHSGGAGAHSSSSYSVFGSLPRQKQAAGGIFHKKQPSLPDYMPMTSLPPPLPARNADFHLSSSLPPGASRPTFTSPSSSDYHIMTGHSPRLPTPLASPDTSNYLPMDHYHSQQVVPASSATTGPLSLRPESPAALPSSSPLRPRTVLTPPQGSGKKRIPSGEAGYVIMSPGVNTTITTAEEEEEGAAAAAAGVGGCTGSPSPLTDYQPASLAALEESLGGRWPSSPRHSSPVSRRRTQLHHRTHRDSQRNSSCLDDNEALWSEWRFNEDPDNPDEFADQIGRSPVGPNDDYMLVNYPRGGGATGSASAFSQPRPISSGLSPASSSSAMSGTPSSDSRFTDFTDRLEKVSSFLRTDDDEASSGGDGRTLASRPPRGDNRRGLAGGGARYMDIPSSKSSSRSNVSPFGRTPPSVTSGSPTVVSRLECLFRHRAGSVPNRPPIFDRRRHRTQSEGEKEAAADT